MSLGGLVEKTWVALDEIQRKIYLERPDIAMLTRWRGAQLSQHPPASKMIKSLPKKILAGTVLLHLLSYNQSSASTCEAGIPVSVGDGRKGIQIDSSWSGATVPFDAIARGDVVYFGYYDADRWLTVADLNLYSSVVCRSRLPSQFSGWDSHNRVALAFDRNGQLHIAANMHGSPLVYGVSARPGNISDISMSPMIGRDEDKVTYPNFINGSDGNLYFVYRNGLSGDGGWFVNVRNGETWRRALNAPIFASTWEGSPTSAYPSVFRVSKDGYVHLAVVWRRSPDLATNYAITYARTRDFVSWTDQNGKPITTPIDPGSSTMIEATGENQGLLNSARVSVTPAGVPIVTYTRYGPDGKNIIVAASPSAGEWRRSTIATAGNQSLAAGLGTVPNLPTFGDLSFSGSTIASVTINFPGEPPRRVLFDADTLLVADAPIIGSRPVAASPLKVSAPPGLTDARLNARKIRIDGMGERTTGSMVYFSQGLNRDQPRECTSSEPRVCAPPPSPLIFVP
ncbi:BNR repeat-containing protein [Ensifer adhaerens]|uniref:BNR repeat-containing protein n=1 Tax=Ensifer adhaerens TaxID=106592 RepID=A0A9Q9DCY1_ENSAD|nr:BNR repeat-containing protein [Ensifer adhaerens]USJ26860.1 BNR repeat-containing protein [Ensifer adhaerens]